ncbi:hypothetical protein Barb4_02051 [Bacteroidales bacterium Barb4]|nr:hypothetical protein Barb4_02051 [Bacteroidales bacterium Barb4]
MDTRITCSLYVGLKSLVPSGLQRNISFLLFHQLFLHKCRKGFICTTFMYLPILPYHY